MPSFVRVHNAYPRHPRRPRERSAMAVVELAICLPVIALIVLGSIECCEMIYLQHALEISSGEGARVAIRKGLPGPGGVYDHEVTNTDVIARSQQFLTERNISAGQVTISVADVGAVPSGDLITVTVSAPAANNVLSLIGFSSGRTLTASMTMIKDYRELPILPPAPPPPPPPDCDHDHEHDHDHG